MDHAAGIAERDILKGLRPAAGGILALRMAPLIDMIFLLLLFFLVSGQFGPREDALPLRLPENDTGLAPATQPLAVSVEQYGRRCRVRFAAETVEFGGETVLSDMDVLMNRLIATVRRQKRTTADPIEVICAPDVKWEHLARIYNVLFGAGLTNITFRMAPIPETALGQ